MPLSAAPNALTESPACQETLIWLKETLVKVKTTVTKTESSMITIYRAMPFSLSFLVIV